MHCYFQVVYFTTDFIQLKLSSQPISNEKLRQNRIEIVTCDICGTETRSSKFVRHTKRCSKGTLQCSQCPNLSTYSQTNTPLLLWFFQINVYFWLHSSITTVMCYWTINPYWKLEFVCMQKHELQSTLEAVFNLVPYPVISVASIDY